MLKDIHWLKAYKKGEDVVKGPPPQIWIEPTNACNLKCVHCIRPQMTRKKGFMDFSLFKKIIDEVSSYNNPPVVSFAGQGEPLLHPDFGKMVRYASKHCKTRVLTNATLLTEEKASEILEAEPYSVGFSFDAPTKEIYEKIRRGANYERTVKNIKNFLNFKQELGKKTRCTISIIKEPLTEGKIEDFKKWCNTLPFDIVAVNEAINFFGDSDLAQTGEIKYDFVKKDLAREKWPVCYQAWNQLHIYWDGFVPACILDYNKKFVVGNAYESTIMDIWNSNKMREFRRALVERNYEKIEHNGTLCSNCSVLWERYDFWLRYQRMSMLKFYYHQLISYELIEEVLRKAGVYGYVQPKFRKVYDKIKKI